jgi:hypothetical protein
MACPDSGGRRLSFDNSDEFQSNFPVVLAQVPRNARILDQARQVALGENEIEMIGAVRFLDQAEVAIQAGGFPPHQAQLLLRNTLVRPGTLPRY